MGFSWRMDSITANSLGRSTLLDGISIHYKLIGDEGPVTLLVHGGGCDLTFWDLQIPALAAHGRVLLLDLPGHGQSEAPEDLRYSMKLHARAINRVMEDAGVESAVVVGHSLGVPALREFCRGWGEKVEGFVALGGVLIYPKLDWATRFKTWLLDTPLYGFIWPRAVDGYTSEATPQWGRDKVNASMKNAPKHVVRSFFKEMLHEETAVNDPLAVPLLAIYAENELSEEIRGQIRALNDDVHLVMMPDVSHFLMLDRPKETNRLLLEFVERVTG
jgi:pimeloyl-ACP methyl ester carboxylesterase